MKTLFLWVPILGLVAIAWTVLFGQASATAGFYLLVGWLPFLARASSRVQIDWPATAAAAACLVLITAGLHGMLSWIARHRQTSAADVEPQRAWAFRWTASIVGVVVLMFVAGIAFIGITHQTAWLLTTDRPRVEERFSRHHSQSSKANLSRIGMGFQNHHDIRNRLPQGGTSAADGTMLHSWMTYLLPFANTMTMDSLDYDLPWDDPKNVAEFRRFVPFYLNPAIGEFRSDQGFALSHYAGNVHVLGGGPALRMADVTDGTAHTMFAGEVAAEFKPWGDPMNWRDPADGVNRLAGGFANPNGDAVQFVFVDGSVRSFGAQTSPRVLQALATPRGGESVDLGQP